MAVLAPISWRVPPRAYGPWEQFASLLTEGLVERGVDVTLFATGDSLTAARLASVVPRGYSEDPEADAKVSECLHIAQVFERAGEFDVIHNSFDFLPLTYSGLVDTPMLTTIHGFSSPSILPVYQRYNARSGYVAISEADRHPSLDYLATIHHGIDTRRASRSSRAPGRISSSSGASIRTRGRSRRSTSRSARPAAASSPGSCRTSATSSELVAPRIDGERVRFIGAVGPDERSEVLGGARALLHLIGFEEPFGFSVVEAMACGTPVIAFRRGSMPELIEHGVTGFLVDDVEAAVAAVGETAELDRAGDPGSGRRAVRARAHGRRRISTPTSS